MFVAYVEHNHQILRAQRIVVAVDLVIIDDALSLIALKQLKERAFGRIETVARTTG